MRSKIFLVILFLIFSMASIVMADTVYLKNGRSIEGLIKKQDDEKLVLDVGFGTVTFRMHEVESIEASTVEAVKDIRNGWERQKELDKKRTLKVQKQMEEARKLKEFEPKEVDYLQSAGHIVVQVLLNKKTEVNLLLDTGASTILLSSKVAKRLKIKDREKTIVQVQVADGRKIDANLIVLDTVSIGGVKVKNVEAVILLDDSQTIVQDGLLGMSFLNRFNFQIDTVNKKLILKKKRGKYKTNH